MLAGREGVFSIYPAVPGPGGRRTLPIQKNKNSLSKRSNVWCAFRKCNNQPTLNPRSIFYQANGGWSKQTHSTDIWTKSSDRITVSMVRQKTHKLKYIPWLIPLLLLMRIPFLFAVPFDEGLNNYSPKKQRPGWKSIIYYTIYTIVYDVYLEYMRTLNMVSVCEGHPTKKSRQKDRYWIIFVRGRLSRALCPSAETFWSISLLKLRIIFDFGMGCILNSEYILNDHANFVR